MKTISILLFMLLGGCAVVDVSISKPDGTSVRASGVSFLKDHGLEGLNYERTGEDAKFQMSGYSSQARVELLLKLLEAMR